MQDDPRQRLDISANGHGHFTTRTNGIETAGQGYDNHSTLTETNLIRHTRLNPPDARDTVAWFLRGLPPGFDNGVDHPQARQASNTNASIRPEGHDRQNKKNAHSNHQSIISHPDRTADDIHEVSQPVIVQGPQVVEQRKSLVASMKSRNESPGQQVLVQKPTREVPLSPSANSEIRQLPPPLQQAPEMRKVPRKITILAEDSQDVAKERPRVKRKHSDAAEEPQERGRQKSAERPTKSSKDGRRKEKQKQKAIESLSVEEPKTDRQSLLDQRKQRRRAKAVIMKDRSKVTGPSEAILKASKKAAKTSIEDEPSKYRKPDKHARPADDDEQAASHRPTSRRRKDRRHNSSDDSDHGEKHESQKTRKRSTDVQRSMRALKDAVKGRRESGKRRRNDPLERAANILPAGRVTLKAKTGIYNHGQASSKHVTGVEAASKRLTDLAFSELPFLNQPVEDSSKSRLLHKQEPSAYRIIADKISHVRGVETTHKPAQRNFTSSSHSASSQSDSRSSSESSSKVASVSTVHNPTSRPKSPKRVNVEDRSRKLKSKRKTTTSPVKPSSGETTKQQNAPTSLHRTQGLSLETRDAGSSAFTPSKAITGESISGNSRNLSTAAESGQLSSLTGLSAGSLVRRRLLRCMDRAGSVVDSSTRHHDLQAELRAFQSMTALGPQAHGPSAKYGTAVINRSNTRAVPQLPDLPVASLPAPTISSRPARITHYEQPADRSPDWLAEHESPMARGPHCVQNPYAPWRHSAIEDEQRAHRRMQEFAGHFDAHRSPGTRTSYDYPQAQLPRYDSQQCYRQETGAEVIIDYSPINALQPLPYNHPYENPIYGDQQTNVAFDDFDYQERAPLGQDVGLSNSHRYAQDVSARMPQDHYMAPQVLYSTSQVQHHQLANDSDNMEDPARFQRGRADLQSYLPYTSSPGPLQPMRGFWQPNYL